MMTAPRPVTTLCRLLSAFLCVLVLLWSVPLPAKAVPAPMTPPRMVNDFAGLFDAQEKTGLEALVQDYEKETAVPVYIVTVSSLEGQDALAYATEIGNAWDIGSRSNDNGIVILIKPNTARGQGATAIALGTGMERLIGDQAAERIITTLMIPRFRNNDFAGGVNRAVHALAAAISTAQQQKAAPPAEAPVRTVQENRQSAPPPSPVQSADPYTQQETLTQAGVLALALFGIFLLFMGVLAATGHGRLAGKIILGLAAFIGAIFALATIFGGRSDGKGGGGFSGGGSSGSFGGKGGPFSGGGASGSW